MQDFKIEMFFKDGSKVPDYEASKIFEDFPVEYPFLVSGKYNETVIEKLTCISLDDNSDNWSIDFCS